MRSLLSAIGRFLAELRRRKVYQVALAYLAAGFVVVELADIAAGAFGLPDWFQPMVWTVVGLGFPIALVLAWALEVTPEGVRVDTAEETSAEEEAPAPRSSVPSLWAGASILALLLVGAWWLFGGLGPAEQASDAGAEIQDRSIAVLPFEVSGAGATEWRDGMVTALTLNLDGAAGLRAIADRTVFAAWNEAGGTEEGTSTEEALAVAREVGARYAVVGSAVQLGEGLRLGAQVRRVGSGERLGQVEVEGPPGSVTALTDELTRKVLGVLLDRSEEAIPSVDIASLTTSSLEALKAYLRGERHFRAGEYEAALDDYKAATRRDSTFALAFARMAYSRDMVVGAFGAGAQYYQQAYERSDRLPSRERGVVRAWHLRYNQGRGVAAADTLRRLSERYPDDPSVWYALGEVLWHTAIPRGLPEADQAFEEALDLDPGVAIYHLHPIDLAFSLHRDSALAAQRIAAAPRMPEKNLFQLAKELAFGSPAQRQDALARLDTATYRAEALPLWPVPVSLLHPTDGALQENVLLRIEKRDDIDGNPWAVPLVANSFEGGQADKALVQMKERNLTPSSRFPASTYPSVSCVLAGEISLGMPVPDSTLRAFLEPSTVGTGSSTSRLRCSGIYLLEKGQGEKLSVLIERIRKEAVRHDVSDEKVQAIIDEFEGYRALQDEDLQRAEKLLGEHNESGQPGAIWRGDLYRKLGGLKKAEGWYLGAWRHPVAHERLGQLYEEMDRPADAAAAYERFIAAWKDADPELQHRVETARQRLRALRNEKAPE